MIQQKEGRVIKILVERKGYTEVLVDISGKKEIAACYPELTGHIKTGDIVILNTTAVSLNLGTGGKHFVMACKNAQNCKRKTKGHIMKLRYTPFQLKVLAVEEEDSPHHNRIKNFQSLSGLPVVVCSLHSMIATVAAGLKELFLDNIKVAYIMSDGGALPINMSNMVYYLKTKGLIDNTITYGHAFGGDYECINIYTALATAKEVINAGAIIVAMGPGIVGTGTPLGFSGIEQAQIIDAVSVLGGHPFAIPRISFSDKRARHFGISHHTLHILAKITCTPATVPCPCLPDRANDVICSQLKKYEIDKKHNVVFKEGHSGIERLQREGITITTMGRTIEEDKEFFLTGGAGAMAVYDYMQKGGSI